MASSPDPLLEAITFDAAGLVNWCVEQAVDARYPIAFDVAFVL